jgi:16S rRNA (guanine966-N2)-methyltransferase
MRIVGGNLRGKKLNFLQSEITRPLRDLVKESIFNIINYSKISRVNLENSNILDLYSGIGSFGIECISRKAKMVSFVENSKEALLLLKKNVDELNIAGKTKIFEQTVNQFIQKNNKEKYDIIFLDPPFKDEKYLNEIQFLKDSDIYNSEHLIIFHRESKNDEQLNGIFKNLSFKNYGRSKLFFGTFS